MKRLITAALCAAILVMSQHIEQPRAQVGPGVFVLIAAAAAGVVVLCVLKHGGNPAIHTFVLYKSNDHASWIPVATNSLRMTLDRAWPAFELDMRKDPVAFYRLEAHTYRDNICIGGFGVRAIPQSNVLQRP